MKLKPLFPPPSSSPFEKLDMGPFGSEGKRKKNFGLSFPFLRSCLIFNFFPSFSQLIRKRSIDSSQMIYLTKKKNANKTLNMFFFISGREKSNCWPSFEIMWETLRIPPKKFRRTPKISTVFKHFLCFPFVHFFCRITLWLIERVQTTTFLLPPLSSLYLPPLRFGRRRRGIGTTFLLLPPPPPPFAPPVPHRTPNQEGGGKEEEEEKDPALPYLRLRSNWRH